MLKIPLNRNIQSRKKENAKRKQYRNKYRDIFTFFSMTSSMWQEFSLTLSRQWDITHSNQSKLTLLTFLGWKYSPYRTDSQLKTIRKLKPNHLLPFDRASRLVHYPLCLIWGSGNTKGMDLLLFPSAEAPVTHLNLRWWNSDSESACYTLSTPPLIPLLLLALLPVLLVMKGLPAARGGHKSWQFHSLN